MARVKDGSVDLVRIEDGGFHHKLRLFILEHGSQRKAAKALGIDVSNLNKVLKGKLEPFGALLEAFGYRRVVKYERIDTRSVES